MAPMLQPPPFHIPMFDNKGRMAEAWREWFIKATGAVTGDLAPSNAEYLIKTANGFLPNALNLGALSSGWLRQTVAAGVATVLSSTLASSQSSPADPTGTADTGGKMMGLAGTITPLVTGKVIVTISGTIFNPTAIADGAKVQIRTGIGTAPANGDALAGSVAGGLVQYIAATVLQKAPFSLTARITGLTVNVARWIDVGLAAITGGTATISDLSVTAFEVQ